MNNYSAIYDYGARRYLSWANAVYNELADKFKAWRNPRRKIDYKTAFRYVAY